MPEKKVTVRSLVRKLIKQLDYEDPMWRQASADAAVEGEEVDQIWIEILKALKLRIPKYKVRQVYQPVYLNFSDEELNKRDGDEWFAFNTVTHEILWDTRSSSSSETSVKTICNRLNRALSKGLKEEKQHDLVGRQDKGVDEEGDGAHSGSADAVPLRVSAHDGDAGEDMGGGAA